MKNNPTTSAISDDTAIISLAFCLVFIVIGILNVVLVHFIPGVFYLFLSLLYFPQLNTFLKKQVGCSIPFIAKIIFGLIILWGTLAVGDLAEIVGL